VKLSAVADAFVALGSNLGDREAHLRFGLSALAGMPGTTVVATSRVYETEPLGPAQHPYLNAVVQISTRLEPRELLDEMLAAETRAGRQRDPAERYAPRTLDLDLLLYGDELIEEPGLRVPHPRMHERAFVLIPLADVAADRVHPVIRASVAELAAIHRGGTSVVVWPHPL
jgi:2-amino-4-hydroxy-6-hydroxymethyldihydropteridine diphosphokinase